MEPLTSAAIHLGLEPNREALGRGAIRGSIAGHSVTLKLGYRARKPAGYILSARAHDRFPGRVTIKPGWLWPAWGGNGRVLSGDRAFDKLLEVYGPVPVVRALLDAEVRAELQAIAAHGRHEAILFRDDRVGARIAFGSGLRAGSLAAIMKSLVRLASEYWLQEKDVRDRLLAHTTSDPDDAVRATNGAMLLELVEDDKERVRLRTYKHLVTSETAPMRQRIEALLRLRTLPAEKAAPIIASLAANTTGELQRLAIAYLGEAKWTPAIESLGKLAARADLELGAQLARALAAIADPRGEQPLLELLAHRLVEVRCAAARALGEIGTLQAIMPLEKAAHRFFGDPALERAAEHAIQAIRVRAGSGEPGELSLVDSGELSLDPRGTVSLPE